MGQAGTTRLTSEGIGTARRTHTELALQLLGASAKAGASRSASAMGTVMDIRTMHIPGGDHGATTVAAAGLRPGAMDGEDTRAQTFMDDGETLRTRALVLPGRIHTPEITVVEPERRFKMLKPEPGEWQAAAPTQTFTPEIPLQVAESPDITLALVSLQVRVPATPATFIAVRGQRAEVVLHTTQILIPESLLEAITFTRGKMERYIATIVRIQVGRKTRGAVGSPHRSRMICNNSKEHDRWGRCVRKVSVQWEGQEVLAEDGGARPRVFTGMYIEYDLSNTTGPFTSRNTIGQY